MNLEQVSWEIKQAQEFLKAKEFKKAESILENLKRVYVDYQSVLPAMEKIFLSVGALHHESTLQYLGQTATTKFTVKRSHNPFRT
ncbi:hypothetical protein [Acinetobacter sp. ANC 3791]|uniref:hypothetical protein n=1 Tax=Acinetobacter sp. ANC 3791 TaxID=2529836 RepID=UPI00103F344B|nr:hypothetical protein [Acinetobacter sp. ANC 3791]TCB84572.1 hypothetical protein E0H90_08685 [Acinetobacter sp. ANC 3791]